MGILVDSLIMDLGSCSTQNKAEGCFLSFLLKGLACSAALKHHRCSRDLQWTWFALVGCQLQERLCLCRNQSWSRHTHIQQRKGRSLKLPKRPFGSSTGQLAHTGPCLCLSMKKERKMKIRICLHGFIRDRIEIDITY